MPLPLGIADGGPFGLFRWPSEQVLLGRRDYTTGTSPQQHCRPSAVKGLIGAAGSHEAQEARQQSEEQHPEAAASATPTPQQTVEEDSSEGGEAIGPGGAAEVPVHIARDPGAPTAKEKE